MTPLMAAVASIPEAVRREGQGQGQNLNPPLQNQSQTNVNQALVQNAILPPSSTGQGTGTGTGTGTGSGNMVAANNPTGTPSDQNSGGARPNPGVQVAGYVGEAQKNVQAIGDGLRKAGMPEQQVQQFIQSNARNK